MHYDPSALRRALAGKKLYLLDMDGTLYLGNRLFPHSKAFLEAIKESGAQYMFLTNNSSKGTDAYVHKLADMGIHSEPEHFFTSTDAACAYLRANYRGKRIYALGTKSFKAQLAREGFPITDEPLDEVDCLLMGYDTEMTYQKLMDASRLLLRDIPYLATNPDWVCPTEFGYAPDCGAFAQALEHATGRLPVFLGKPEPAIAQLAMAKAGVAPRDTVLVGDRIYTDIACAKRAGVMGVLVFSGETTPAVLAGSDVKPDFALTGVEQILAALRSDAAIGL